MKSIFAAMVTCDQRREVAAATLQELKAAGVSPVAYNFKALKIDQHKYSRAWVPYESNAKK